MSETTIASNMALCAEDWANFSEPLFMCSETRNSVAIVNPSKVQIEMIKKLRQRIARKDVIGIILGLTNL